MEKTPMETIEIRKETMRVAKSILFITLIGIASCTTDHNYKEAFQGSFYQKYEPNNRSASYSFTDKDFNILYNDHQGDSKKLGGTYQVADDTLMLNFKSLVIPDSSNYKFIKRVPLPDTVSAKNSYVRFNIVDHHGKPLMHPYIISHDSSKNSMGRYSPDSLGHTSALPVKKGLHDFTILFVGHKPVVIPGDTLLGYHSNIKIMLSKAVTNYRVPNDEIRKYLITKAEKDRIILKPLGENKLDRLVLVRVSTDN